MSQTVKINGVTYEAKVMQAPLASDPSKMAVFHDTSDATAVAASTKKGDTFYAGGEKRTGTMPVNGAGGGVISTKDGKVSIKEGHYDGTGSVSISETEQAKIVAANIRKGITILGVEGGMDSTEGMKSQSKEVTPTKSEQVVAPDSGYNCLAQVTVEAIPDKYQDVSGVTAALSDVVKGKKIVLADGTLGEGTHTDPSFTLANGVLTIA